VSGWGRRKAKVDEVLARRIGEAALERRRDEITTAIFGFFIEELNDDELVARLRRIRSEERARIFSEDTAAAMAAVTEETRSENGSGTKN
jgi:hypothetical protein